MSTHIKIDGMAFSGHAELLRKELAQTFTQKAVEWVHKKNITNPERINTLAIYFLKKAEEEFEHTLRQDFPNPDYEPYIGLACLGSIKFFDNLRETIKISIHSSLASKAGKLSNVSSNSYYSSVPSGE